MPPRVPRHRRRRWPLALADRTQGTKSAKLFILSPFQQRVLGFAMRFGYLTDAERAHADAMFRAWDPRSSADRSGSTTVGGLVVTTLGRLPQAGEHVDHSGARFTVERMEGRRIDAVRARLLARAPNTDE